MNQLDEQKRWLPRHDTTDPIVWTLVACVITCFACMVAFVLELGRGVWW